MTSFKMILPNNKTIDMTKGIQESKSEEDVKKVITKALKKGVTK